MRTFSSIVAFVVVLYLIAPAAEARQRAVRSRPPDATTCTVNGLPGFFFSEDAGFSFSRNEAGIGLGGAFDVAVMLDNPDVLVTVVRQDVFDSTDGGCNWSKRFTIPDQIKHPIDVVPATGGRAFVWAEEFIYRYDNGAVIGLPLPEAPGGLGVDPGNRDHVRLLGIATGKAWQSLDGGLTWTATGGSAGGRISSAAFDVSNVNHIIVAVFSSGLLLSSDGGRTWSNGFTPPRVVCRLAFAPSSPNVVWMTTSTLNRAPSVFRSTDGGQKFEAIGEIVAIENGVCLPLIVNPHDPNIAAIPHGAIRRYDAITKTAVLTACCTGFVERAAYSAADPDKIYVLVRPSL